MSKTLSRNKELPTFFGELQLKGVRLDNSNKARALDKNNFKNLQGYIDFAQHYLDFIAGYLQAEPLPIIVQPAIAFRVR